MKQQVLGKKITALRLSQRLTQIELAEKCNLSLRTIQRIEADEVVPRSHTIKTIYSNLDYQSDKSDRGIRLRIKRIGFEIKKKSVIVLRFLLVLINLKKHTMKKLSVLSLIVILVSLGLFLSKENASAQSIEGWSRTGTARDSYRIGLDKNEFTTGTVSAFLESTEKKIDGFGSLVQTSSATIYLGKRVKMTASIKSKNVKNYAAMWWRVDDKEGNFLSFDNMSDRQIKGSVDWTKYEITLDVPISSDYMHYGILINGTGKLWIDNITFEIVGELPPRTKDNKSVKPTNLDFEN